MFPEEGGKVALHALLLCGMGKNGEQQNLPKTGGMILRWEEVVSGEGGIWMGR